jgi:hypothetical protein
VSDRADLLAVRGRQLEVRDEDIAELALRKKRHREEGKEHFDATHNLRAEKLKQRDIVLHHDPQSKIDKSSDRKLSYKWFGPYRIAKADSIKGTYQLEEMDGVPLKGTFSGNRLKKFVRREGVYYPAQGHGELPQIEIRLPQLSEAEKNEFIPWSAVSDDDS